MALRREAAHGARSPERYLPALATSEHFSRRPRLDVARSSRASTPQPHAPALDLDVQAYVPDSPGRAPVILADILAA